WWKLAESDEPERDVALEEEVAAATKRFVLPFLERFHDEHTVAEFLSQPCELDDKFVEPRADGLRLAYAAIIWQSAGNRIRCQESIEKAVLRSKRSPLEGVLNDFVRRFAC